MIKRNFKNTDLKISLLGLGCMRLPKIQQDKDDINFEEAQKIVDYAYENGINYFDTAFMYHGGTSEDFLGKALQKFDRSTYFLATKMPVWMADTPKDVEQIFNTQLKKLNTSYFDFYLCHNMTKENFKILKEFKTYEFLKKKKEEGVIRHLGFSFHDKPEVLEEICSEYDWDFAQIQLNYLDWEVQDAKSQYEILEKHNLPCIIMEPVRGGALASLCDESDKVFKDSKPDKSIASWAIRYAASLSNVITVLSGMSNMEQIIDNVNTMNNFEPMTKEDYETVKKAVEYFKEKQTIPCTGCRYCIECPKGVNIPKIFEIYNKYAIYKRKDSFKEEYITIDNSEKAENCIECGKCVKHCPQAINIIDKLNMIKSFIV